MYVVVAGAGEVGYHISKALRQEGHSVAVVEPDKAVLDRAQDLDVLLVQGNGASLDYLEQAGIKKADIFIGATGNDEANMIGCAIAKSFGMRTIARINNPAYLDETVSFKYKPIGVDVAVCPELVAAQKVANLLRAPALASAEIFAQGRVAVVESKVLAESPVRGKKLSIIRPPAGINLVAILRGSEVIIPRGEDVLEGGDRVLMTVLTPTALKEAETSLGLRPGNRTGRMNRLVIAGGSRIGIRLARLLENQMEVVIIERDKEVATQAFEQVKNALVISGDATRMDLLKSEGVEHADAFVGASREEEYNVLACLVAKQLGVRNTICFTEQAPLKPMLEDRGVDLALTIRQATVSSLLRWCHQMEALDLALIGGGDAQVIEVRVPEDSAVAGRALKKIGFPKSTIVGAIVRGDETILPRGEDEIKAGDRLIIFALTEAMTKLEKLLRK